MTTRDKVNELEKEHDVASLTVHAFGKSFQLYPWLKGRLFHKMVTGQETMQRRTFGLYLKQIGSLFYGLHNLFRKYDIWAFTSSAERRLVDGKYYDKLFDYIGNETGNKTLLIELRLFQYYPYRKIASNYAISRSFFLAFEVIYGKLFLRNSRVNDPALLQAINNKVAGGINHQLIIRKYLAQYKMMKFWLKVLPNPKVVFVAVSYTNFGYIRAFKEKGIKVVEMQHGIISDNHHAYYYAAEMNPDQFPDYLLTVGEREVDVFNAPNCFPVGQVIPVGSFIIDDRNARSQTVKRERPTILFTLQDGEMASKLIAFVLELKKAAGESIAIVIQARRTPKSEYLSNYPELAEIPFSDTDFYTAVTQADIHSTVYSTTAIEALSLGIPNILVNIDNQSVEQLGTILTNSTYTSIVTTVQAFLEEIPMKSNLDKMEIQKSNERNIKVGYRDNIKLFLKEVVK